MFSKIECPVCGYEYLPAEIFVPRAIFGTPGFIRRDVLGKIEAFSGTKEDFTESYICDNCKVRFNVTMIPTFETTSDKRHDFESDYKSKI